MQPAPLHVHFAVPQRPPWVKPLGPADVTRDVTADKVADVTGEVWYEQALPVKFGQAAAEGAEVESFTEAEASDGYIEYGGYGTAYGTTWYGAEYAG